MTAGMAQALPRQHCFDTTETLISTDGTEKKLITIAVVISASVVKFVTKYSQNI